MISVNALHSQTTKEEMARQELEKRGIDEEELRSRLIEKNINLDELKELSPQEALEAQQVIEETINEMEREDEEGIAQKQPAPLSLPQITDTTEKVGSTSEIQDTIKTSQVVDVAIYGQHIFKNQSLEVYTRSNDVKPPDSYVLGPGDEVIVAIWGLSRLDENLVINKSGYVTPYKMPRVFLQGFTFDQVRQILRDRYAQYYRFRKNEFEVTINYSRTIQVNIFGEVENYGGFTIPATNTAFNALVAAGGPNDIGSVRRITLRRNGEVRTIDVYAFMKDPGVAADFYLQNNDIIQVPVAQNVVEISGEVNRPFRYELLEEETVEDAITYAGGFTTEALTDRIRVLRYEGGMQRSIDVDYNISGIGGRDFTLKHGDKVVVLPIQVRDRNVVTITGEVTYPGEYAREQGMTLSDLIEKAGLLPSTRHDLAFLKRRNGDGTVSLTRLDLHKVMDGDADDQLLLNGDEIIVYARSRYVDSAYFEIIGAVREPGRFLFDRSGQLTIYDAILLSGGLKRNAQSYAYIYRDDTATAYDLKYIRVDLLNATKAADSPENISLLPGDRVVIGSKKQLIDEQYIDVGGAVRQPGRYEFGTNMTLIDALSLSGGFTYSAASNRIDLFRVEIEDNRATKTVIKTIQVDKDLAEVSQADNVLLQPFDQIVVREVPEFEFQQNVRVEGEVRYPGLYALSGDNERLSSLIERAGDLTLEAFPQGATLFRSLDSIGYVVIDLEEAMKNSGSKFNIILKDGDVIDVPKQQDLVRVTGYTNAAQQYPDRILSDQNGIAVPFHPGKNARFYIDEFAAGVADNGNPCDITVEHANGQIEKTRNFGLFKSYPQVRPGSIIRVGIKETDRKERSDKAEREEVDWGKIFANSVAQATTILSLILLLQRID
ncbi:MAG: SLBB domain-containing protein [Saprospiraceae bacterium]|nr:SLBB domain-containing protein [Saprospiraceae bacterium]